MAFYSVILNLGILGAGTFINLTNKNYDGLGLIAAGLFNLSYILVNEVNTLAKLHTDAVENAYLDAGGEYDEDEDEGEVVEEEEEEEGDEEEEEEGEVDEEEEEDDDDDTEEYVGSEEGEVVEKEEDNGYVRTFDSENNLIHLSATQPIPPPASDMPGIEDMSSEPVAEPVPVTEPVTEPVAEPVPVAENPVLPPPAVLPPPPPPPPFVPTKPPPPPAAPRKVKRDDASFEI